MISSKKFYEVLSVISGANASYLGYMNFKFDGMNEDYAYFSVVTITDNMKEFLIVQMNFG